MTDYTTVEAVKSRLHIEEDAQHDETIRVVITGVSRWIEWYCGRRFTAAASATRYYTAEDGEVVYVDDLQSVSALATDDGSRTYGTSWSASQFDLAPYNAVADGLPCTKIYATRGYAFPAGKRGVRVTGSFGWTAVPEAVEQACALQAMRLFKRDQAIFGVVGSAELGQQLVIPKMDPDVMLLLAPLRRGPMV